MFRLPRIRTMLQVAIFSERMDTKRIGDHMEAIQRTEPQSLRGRTLSASLTVNDLAKSLAWYEGVVGFTVDQKHEREGRLVAVSLKAGDVRILIGQDDGKKGLNRVKGEGMSLHIATVQNVDALAKQVKDRGGVLELEPTDMPWGARLFRVRDPDGFTLNISSQQ
jgi:uncharacterized glyoxalase superfamily protein PhnB